jgi:dTDP-4-amino-4,6-dideoxygalactose transaminase
MFNRIISASLSPNTESEDVLAALAMVMQPWKWRQGAFTGTVTAWFEKQFAGYRAFAYNSGRAALTDILSAYGITTGDEVLVQAFTCVAVPNAVLWAGATPIYVDVDGSLNIDVTDAAKKITKKTRAIIVQHTLGITADMTAICAFAKKHSLLVIEDCAHALGGTHEGKQIGSIGDAAFFSFGRDKVLSSVFGGMAIIRSSDTHATTRMQEIQRALQDAPIFWIFQQLLHPIIFSIVLPLYTTGIGKGMLWFFQRLRLLSFPVYAEEKCGEKPSIFPSRYPSALAYLLIPQLRKLDRYNARRSSRAAEYIRELKKNTDVELLKYPGGSIFLRLPICISNPGTFIQKAKRKGILIGNWYQNTIDPAGVDFSAVGYTKGSCPQAESYATRVINLPTNVSQEDASRVLSLFS